ncbi:MAG: hypothetical protein HY712_00475 [candidate division NC10 bacterium]|nr:hypothetical protein [candidate division NC10 bacterium]
MTVGWTRFPLVALVAASLALASCAHEAAPPLAPGSPIYETGAGRAATTEPVIIGPLFNRPAILEPVGEPAWQETWVEKKAERSPLGGAAVGFLAGTTLAQIGPVAILFWPAAVGIVAGSTVLGAAGGMYESPETASRPDPDRQAIAEATRAARPDRMLREAAAEALARRVGTTLPRVPRDAAREAAAAEEASTAHPPSPQPDGVLEFAIEALGLSTTEETDLFGLFLRVRVLAREAKTGALRYRRVVSHGPIHPVPDLPRVPAHSLDLLAMDGAGVYRHQLGEIVRQVARLIAEDPALPIVSR